VSVLVSLYFYLFCRCLLLRKKATKKPSKHPRTFSDSFQNDDADMGFNDHYKRASIILERTVDLESLEGTIIPEVFKERTWTKLLNPMGNVCGDVIWEFFANAIVEDDHINCWLKGREFSISRDFGDLSNDSSHTSTIWWEKGKTRTPRGIPWWMIQQEGLAHHYVHPENVKFGLHHDLQPLPDEELDEFVSTEDHIPIWSLHSQGDRHL